MPRNHNTRDENRTIRNGKVPQDWSGTPAKRSRKDTDARWTGKHGKSHYGYRNHVNVDRRHKPVRRCHVTDAALHDSQAVDSLSKAFEARLPWARHKQYFFRENDQLRNLIDYAAAVSGQIQLISTGEALGALKQDYQAMLDAGLLRSDAASFEDLINRLEKLQHQANADKD